MSLVEKKPEEQLAAQPPEQKIKREFRPLLTGDRIDRCSFTLPSRLQCWKAGEEEVKETLSDKTTRTYQLCERHVRIQKALDAGSLKDEDINTPLKEMVIDPPQVAPDFEAAPKDQTQKEQEAPKEAEQPKPVQASKTSKEVEQKEKTEGSFFHHHTGAEEKK